MAKQVPPDDRRCTATAKHSGERCKNYSKPFQEVCREHGGESPQAKRKAFERMAAAMAPLAKRKIEMAEDVWEKYAEAKENGVEEKMAFWFDKFNDIFEQIADRAGPPKVKRSEMTGENGGAVEMDVDGEGLTPETIDKLAEAIDGE